jgi:hypothetical protein
MYAAVFKGPLTKYDAQEGKVYSMLECAVFAVVFFKWVPFTTAWSVLRLRIEETAFIKESSCEYIE